MTECIAACAPFAVRSFCAGSARKFVRGFAVSNGAVNHYVFRNEFPRWVRFRIFDSALCAHAAPRWHCFAPPIVRAGRWFVARVSNPCLPLLPALQVGHGLETGAT
jgi:hypothetical protein